MILDSSPIIAILAEEADAERFIHAITLAPHCRISAGNFIELSIVIESQFSAEVLDYCDEFFHRAGIVIAPVTAELAHIARRAFRDFGKGRHPAALNFGDCFAYSLAKHSGEPLLFKGNDFSKTDIISAL